MAAELKKRRGSLLTSKEKKKENDLVVKTNPLFGTGPHPQHGTLKTTREYATISGTNMKKSGSEVVSLGSHLDTATNEGKTKHTRHSSIRAPRFNPSSGSDTSTSILAALGIGDVSKLRLPLSASTFTFSSPPSPKSASSSGSSLTSLFAQPQATTSQSHPGPQPSTPAEDASSASADAVSGQTDGKRSIAPKMAKFVYQHNQDKVIREIILTEAAYVRDLKLLITLYVEPIRSKGVLTPEEINDIFSNVEMLFVINNTLLQKLLQAQQTGNNPVNEFLELKEYLKLYSVYCANQSKSMTTVRECRKKQPFAEFLQEVYQAPQCHKQDINSFLIKPIQRLCKYPLLIRELIKCTTPDDPQYKTLQEALFELQKLVQSVEEEQFGKSSLSVQKDLEKAWDVRKKIDFTDSPISIVQAGRALIGEYGPMRVVQEDKKEVILETVVFLFTDMLLWANAKAITAEKKMKMIGHLILSAAQVTTEDTAEEYFIELHGQNEEVPKTVKFGIEYKERRDAFVYDIQQVIEQLKEKGLSSESSPRPKPALPAESTSTSESTTPTPENSTNPQPQLPQPQPASQQQQNNACTVSATLSLPLPKSPRTSPSTSPSVSPRESLRVSTGLRPQIAHISTNADTSTQTVSLTTVLTSSPEVAKRKNLTVSASASTSTEHTPTQQLDDSTLDTSKSPRLQSTFRSGSARELRKRWEESKPGSPPPSSQRLKPLEPVAVQPSRSNSPPAPLAIFPLRKVPGQANQPPALKDEELGLDNESIRQELLLQKQQLWRLTSLLNDFESRLQTLEKENKKLKLENVKLTNQILTITMKSVETKDSHQT